MIVKYIKCDVKADLTATFSKGQECWQRTTESDGFIIQVGGWDKTQAVIIALWDDMASVQRFMQQSHDTIANKASQQDCYQQIYVDYLQPIAVAATNGLEQILTNAGSLRIDEYNLLPENQTDFIESQLRFWQSIAPTMNGCLGWQLLRSNKTPEQLLMLSGWTTAQHKQHSIEHDFPAIEQTAIHSHNVKLAPNWFVASSSLLPDIESS